MAENQSQLVEEAMDSQSKKSRSEDGDFDLNSQDLDQIITEYHEQEEIVKRKIPAKKNGGVKSPFETLCNDINNLGTSKTVLRLTDLKEKTTYKIIAVRHCKSMADNMCVVVELKDGLIYLPNKYRDYFLKEVFCVDEHGVPLRGKRSCYENFILDNELRYVKLSLTIEKNASNFITIKILHR